MFPEGKADWSTLNTDLAEQIAKKNGKIGVAIPEYAGGKQGMTYLIFEDNIPVKTKSQLIDIWKKANQPSQPLQEARKWNVEKTETQGMNNNISIIKDIVRI